jgi:hypothetical protein
MFKGMGPNHLTNLVGIRSFPKVGLKMIWRKCSRPYVIVEVADDSLPSSALLGRYLAGNLRMCPKLDPLTLHKNTCH